MTKLIQKYFDKISDIWKNTRLAPDIGVSCSLLSKLRDCLTEENTLDSHWQPGPGPSRVLILPFDNSAAAETPGFLHVDLQDYDMEEIPIFDPKEEAGFIFFAFKLIANHNSFHIID